MEELARRLDADTDKLLSRWEGRPDLVIEDIFRVRDLESKEVVDLDLTSYQKQFVHAYWYGEASTVNVLKGRRTGYSFIACATILLDAITTPHGFFAITGPSKSQAKDRIDDIYDLIEWSKLEFELPIDNRDEIELPNGATIMAFAGNPDTSRGADSADTLYIDEMAFLEDQEESMNAFSPFTSLGDAQTVEISTPFTGNDLFMQDNKRGSPTGENGIISIEQPAFENPDEIDENKSLLQQDVEPVMPYLDLKEAEKDRARDPKGFRQEYLCEPVEDEYRFFDKDAVEASIERGSRDDYSWGLDVGKQRDGTMVMAVDFATSHDDTAVTIVEHSGSKRFLRYHEAVTDSTLKKAGIQPADRSNPSSLATRVKQLYVANDVDYVVTDSTGMGDVFNSEIREEIGRGINAFNFDNKDDVADMMGDMNYGLHNGHVVMVDDEKLREQLLAIVKEQSSQYSTPRFSGKDHAPDGKDDLAISFVLACYPPNLNDSGRSLQERDDNDTDVSVESELSTNASSDDSNSGGSFRGVQHSSGRNSSGYGEREYNRRHRLTSRR